MIRTIAALAIAMPLLSGCVVIHATKDHGAVSTAGMPGALEPIHAAAFINDQAVFRVSSGGCTSRDDIEPVVSRFDDDTVITLRRIKDDRCEAYLADGVEFTWSYLELGLEPGTEVRVNNPYLLPPSN